jgi:hypothetical protein
LDVWAVPDRIDIYKDPDLGRRLSYAAPFVESVRQSRLEFKAPVPPKELVRGPDSLRRFAMTGSFEVNDYHAIGSGTSSLELLLTFIFVVVVVVDIDDRMERAQQLMILYLFE